jgi:hypothetical protein
MAGSDLTYLLKKPELFAAVMFLALGAPGGRRSQASKL